jgi:hypothetical protein
VAAVPGCHPHTFFQFADIAARPWPFRAVSQPSEAIMQFFIAAGVLLTASTAFLLHQFWTRELSADDDAAPDATEIDPASELKAA